MESPIVQFAELARSIAIGARSLGLIAPVFRSPPRIVGVSRTIRHRTDGQAVVSVAYRHRLPVAVAADMIDSVILVNDLSAHQASRVRDDLWQVVADQVRIAA